MTSNVIKGFTELSENEMLFLEASGLWGAVATGLMTVGAVGLGIAFAPEEAAVGAAVVTGYYISIGLTAVSGAVATYLAYES